MRLLMIVLSLLLDVPSYPAEVFLSLTRSDLPISDAPVNASVVKVDQVAWTSARTVGDAIELEPGLVIRRSGAVGSAQFPSLRGFASKRVLLVIDDVPQIPDLTGTVDLSRIPLDQVERVEVLRGGASAVYGPNAEGGVIQVITRRPATKVDAELATEMGSLGTYSHRLRAGTSQGPVKAQFTASRLGSEGFQENGYSQTSFLSGHFSCDFQHRGRLSYDGSGSRGTLGLPSGTPVPLGEWDGTRERRANDRVARQTESDETHRFEYEAALPLDLKLTTRLGDNVVDRTIDQFGVRTLIRTEGRSASARLEAHTFGSAGYDYAQRRLDSNDYGVRRGDSWGIFYQVPLVDRETLKILPGLRYDRDNVYGESWSPRLLIVSRPGVNWKISASAGRSFQAPSFADLFDPYVPESARAPHLRPEVTWSYDLGFAARPSELLELSASFYRTDTRDRITTRETPVPPFGPFDVAYPAYNLDRAFTQGVETRASCESGPISQSLSWTYLQAEGKATGTNYRVLAFAPKHALGYAGSIRGPWNTRFSARVRYLHRQWTGAGETGVQIPGYTTVALKLVKTEGWAEFFAAADNVLDRRFAETADAFNGYFPQPGRILSVGASVRFLK